MKMRRRGLWREGRGYGAVCTSIIILGWGSTVAVMIIKLISKNSGRAREGSCVHSDWELRASLERHRR